ncbi:MAG: HAD family phosphatase [Gemmataceae bacterium]|nr:HAD family phosphatase [Gemmataceae bacterium]
MKTIAFDLDGVLLDSEPVFIEAARRVLADRGVAFDPTVMQEIMGRPGKEALPHFRTRFGLSDTIEALGADYKRHFYESLDGLIPLMPHARELVERLVELKTTLALVTSSQRAYVERVFGPHGLLEHFHVTVTADDITHGKPHPEPYLTAARLLGLAPESITVIEDSPAGVKSAKAAGCYCVAVPQKHTDRALVAVADRVIASLAEY